MVFRKFPCDKQPRKYSYLFADGWAIAKNKVESCMDFNACLVNNSHSIITIGARKFSLLPFYSP